MGTAFKNKSFKTLPCKECKEPVEKVSTDASAVTCWKCVHKSLTGKWVEPEHEIKSHDKDSEHNTTD